MVELGSKHPSLAKAMINEYEIKQRYIVEHRERFKDRTFDHIQSLKNILEMN
jgi:hypothetical protein